MSTFQEIQDQARELIDAASGRDEMYNAMEDMYFIRDEQTEKSAERNGDLQNVKLTLSPDAAISLDGAVRLMVATDPTFSVPHDDKVLGSEQQSDAIEKFCAKSYTAAGKLAGTPVHYDPILAGLLYGTAHMEVVNTNELLKAAKGKGMQGARLKRVEYAARRTPYLFRSYNPRTCYSASDDLGVYAHLRKVQLQAGQVRGNWGPEALPEKVKDTDPVQFCEYWDLDTHAAWIDGDKEPILLAEHKLPFIPLVVATTEGSANLFTNTYEQARPFLYKLWKSGMWSRQNLSLTVLYTIMFAIGSNPMFIHKQSQPGEQLDMDYATPGGVVHLPPGSDLGPMLKQVIDPSLMTGLTLANDKVTEATIYKQALGQPMGSGTAFSTVALLNQSGRLPLVQPQKRLSWALGRAMEIAIAWMKEDGAKRTVQYNGSLELDPSTIPDDVEVEAALEINLPQDRLQMANIANLLTSSGLMSKEWVRSEILQQGQSGEMDRKIWTEQAQGAMFQMFLQDQQQQQQMMAQQQQAMMQAQQQQMMAQAQPQPQQGMAPQMQGLPPELAMMGGQGPEQPPMGGEGMMP